MITKWMKPKDRFWAQVEKSEGCWNWTGACKVDKRGGRRGVMEVNAKPIASYRFSWELHNGPIPIGMYVCHHCDNPLCVRPEHLFIGDNSLNQRDALAKGKHGTQTHPTKFAELGRTLRKRAALGGGK